MGGTAQFVERRATCREERRDARAPQWHTRSSLDNSGMRPAEAARSRPDIRAPPERESCALGRSDARLSREQPDVIAQILHSCLVRARTRTNCDVLRRASAKGGDQLEAHQLAKPSLHTIAANGTVLVTRNHDRDPRLTKRGRENSDIEVRRPNPPPLSNEILNFRASRQTIPAREAKAAPPVRRLRTCLAV